MKKTFLAFSFAAAMAAPLLASAQSNVYDSAITYQGRLDDGGAPATGTYDFSFKLFDGTDNAAAQVGSTITLSGVAVAGGLFTVALDFGVNAFSGEARWLEIAVHTNGNYSYSVLTPRQPLTATPYSLYAPSAGVATVANGVSSSAIIQGQSLLIGVGNILSGTNATISGGASNTVSYSYASVVGGYGNVAADNAAAVGGGAHNLAVGSYAVVSGGESNLAYGAHSFVGGGLGNSTTGDYSFVGGGLGNDPGPYSVVSGGQNNDSPYSWSFVGGGFENTNATDFGMLGCGAGNTLSGGFGVLGGGRVCSVSGVYGSLLGGEANSLLGSHGFVGGGGWNSVNNDYGVIMGGSYNTNRCSWGTIGGGSLNLLQAPLSATIAGGYQNQVFGQDATVGGGSYNTVNANDGVIAGGNNNVIQSFGQDATVGGGSYNAISANEGVIAGGDNNVIDSGADGAAIPGGFSAHAFNYGQHVFASGYSLNRGDAQSSLYVLRRNTSGANTYEMFLDGDNGSKRIHVPAGSVWTFRIQVSAVSTNLKSSCGSETEFAAYEARGVVANLPTGNCVDGSVRPIELHLFDGTGAPITTAHPLYESTIFTVQGATSWQATPQAYDADKTLRVFVNGSAPYNVRWTATIQTTEVLAPIAP